MAPYLVCQLCGEKFCFNPCCSCTLGEHLLKKHPDAEMAHFVVQDMSICSCDKDSDSGSFDRDCLAMNGNPSSFSGKGGSANKSGVFKTTVETWKPGPMKVTCPLCGKEDRPCIKKERNKVAYTQMGAMCMISCWPICFLPFLMPQASGIQLYCRHCGALLGEYNRKTGALQKPASSNATNKVNVPSNLC